MSDVTRFGILGLSIAGLGSIFMSKGKKRGNPASVEDTTKKKGIRKGKKKFQLISLFSGAGGMDLGFQKAGFDVILANEYDPTIWETYEKNNTSTKLIKKDIKKISPADLPQSYECDGIIGGPPCTSWSTGGEMRGIEDDTGKLFFEYIKIVEAMNPLFFVVENVSGMLLSRHDDAVKELKGLFENVGRGYDLQIQLLNAADYGVPQDRKRVFYVGFRKDVTALRPDLKFEFPKPSGKKVTLKNAIFHLRNNVLPVVRRTEVNGASCAVRNHEYLVESYSSMYMSSNRVRGWDEVSFTIPSAGRQVPQHPQAPKMPRLGDYNYIFVPEKKDLYRRLSVRECANIQTFPEDFIFYYKNIGDGYKMIGNAVPVNLAKAIGDEIMKYLIAIGCLPKNRR